MDTLPIEITEDIFIKYVTVTPLSSYSLFPLIRHFIRSSVSSGCHTTTIFLSPGLNIKYNNTIVPIHRVNIYNEDPVIIIKLNERSKLTYLDTSILLFPDDPEELKIVALLNSLTFFRNINEHIDAFYFVPEESNKSRTYIRFLQRVFS